MAFIDNSGNIILDAVLTDLGRELLARGDGSFKISHFGLGDDEINYALFDTGASTGAESTTIKQLPVFEALTANNSALKHRLLNIVRDDLVYLPIMKLNELNGNTQKTANGYFAVCVDKNTEDLVFAGTTTSGVLYGANPGGRSKGGFIRIDQGLDTADISPTEGLDTGLRENNYKFKLDNRFGRIISVDSAPVDFSEIDLMNIASYNASLDTSLVDNPIIKEITDTTDSTAMTIAGPRGTSAEFKVKTSDELRLSTALFTKLGSEMAASTFGASGTLYYIDSALRVEGGNTGFTIDIPIRFIKKK